jgi:hypothetical protein
MKFWVSVVAGSIIVSTVLLYLYTTRQEVIIAEKPEMEATSFALRELTSKWQDTITVLGPEEAHKAFLLEAISTSSAAISPHDQAHAFGEALYAVAGLSGLSYCDSSFEFGCYHSFFGIAVAKEGIGILPEFKDACTSRYPALSLPCQHGIGHGVLVYTDYENIVKALELCETIADLPTGGCSSGVFMEYNFHTMDESQSDNYVREKNDDVYAPCNALPLRFQPMMLDMLVPCVPRCPQDRRRIFASMGWAITSPHYCPLILRKLVMSARYCQTWVQKQSVMKVQRG